MAIFNRVYCPHCSKQQNIYDDNLKKCCLLQDVMGKSLLRSVKEIISLSFMMDPVRKRKKIGPSRVLAETC